MNRLLLRAVQRFEAIHLAFQSQPGCEDATLQLIGTPENTKPNIAAPSRVWLVNLLDDRYGEKTTNLVDPTSTSEYSGAVLIGRRPNSDILLKDRAISTTHLLISWNVEIERSTPTTAVWSPSKTSGSRFSPGDKVSICINYRDFSSNGTYEGTSRKPRDTSIDINPFLLYGDANRDPIFKVMDQPHDIVQQTVSLGRMAPYSESARGNRPVFAFLTGVMMNAPWHEPVKRLSTLALKAFKWDVDPDRIKLITPEKQARRKAIVKAEPLVSPRRRPSDTSTMQGGLSTRSVVGSLAELDTHGWLDRRPGAELGSPQAADIHTLKARLQKLTEEVLVASRERDAAVASQKEVVEMLETKLAEATAKGETEVAKLNARIRELETQLSEQIRKYESLKRESEQRSSELDVELGLSRRKIATLTTNLEKVSKERDESVSEKNKFQEEVERLELRRKQAVDQAAENQKRLSEVDEQRSLLQMEVDKVTSKLETAIASGAKRDLDHNKLQRALSDAEASVAHWEQKAKSMELELSSARNSLATSGIEKSNLLNQIDQWRKRSHTSDTALQRQTALAAGFCEELSQKVSDFHKSVSKDVTQRPRRINEDLIGSLPQSKPIPDPPFGDAHRRDYSDDSGTDDGSGRPSHLERGFVIEQDSAESYRDDVNKLLPAVLNSYPPSVEDDDQSHAPTETPTDHDGSVEDDEVTTKYSHKRKLFTSSGEEELGSAAGGSKRSRQHESATSEMEESESPTQPNPGGVVTSQDTMGSAPE